MPNHRLIAIIDDDLSYRKATERLLHAYGWECRSFESAKAFLDIDKVEVISCLLLDIHMPEMTGIDLLKQLRSKGIEISCLFVTAHMLSDSQMAIVDKFKAEVLPKPCDAPYLIEAIARACVGSKAS
ncbi:MAG: response regulator [Opitutaceae bacterium]|nr:response regulator [Opitutaceae bacterium]